MHRGDAASEQPRVSAEDDRSIATPPLCDDMMYRGWYAFSMPAPVFVHRSSWSVPLREASGTSIILAGLTQVGDQIFYDITSCRMNLSRPLSMGRDFEYDAGACFLRFPLLKECKMYKTTKNRIRDRTANLSIVVLSLNPWLGCHMTLMTAQSLNGTCLRSVVNQCLRNGCQ